MLKYNLKQVHVPPPVCFEGSIDELTLSLGCLWVKLSVSSFVWDNEHWLTRESNLVMVI